MHLKIGRRNRTRSCMKRARSESGATAPPLAGASLEKLIIAGGLLGLLGAMFIPMVPAVLTKHAVDQVAQDQRTTSRTRGWTRKARGTRPEGQSGRTGDLSEASFFQAPKQPGSQAAAAAAAAAAQQ